MAGKKRNGSIHQMRREKLRITMNLRNRLILTVCLLLILACTCIAAMATVTFRNSLTQSTGEALLNMAKQGANLVSSRIDFHLTVLEGIAGRNVIRSMEWDKQKPAMEAEIKRMHYLPWPSLPRIIRLAT